MKIKFFVALTAVFLFSACGVSEKKKEFMQGTATSLQWRISPLAHGISISNIRKEKMSNTESYYMADFECSFNEYKNRITIKGYIGFNYHGDYAIVLPPQEAKLPVYISSIIFNGDSIAVANSDYNKPEFLSSKEKVEEEKVDYVKLAQKKAVQQLKSWGADSAYVSSDNYLVYVVEEYKLSSSPAEVSRLMFELFSDVPEILGVRVVSKSTNNTLAEYHR